MKRSAGGRVHGFSALVLGVFALPAVVRADPFEAGKLRLEWDAPSGCPNAAELVARTETLLGAKVSEALEAPLAARARVHQAGPAHFELSLETFQSDQRFTRRMAAPTCAELGDATALVLALAIDPLLHERLAETGSAAPAPASAPTAPASASAAPPAAAAPPPPPPAPPPTKGASKNAPARVTPDGPELSGLASAGLLFDLGSVAPYAFGVTLGLGGRLGAFELVLDGNWLPPRRSFAELDPGKGGDISLLAASLRPCFAPRAGRLEPGLCGVFELGDIAGEGFGTVTWSTRHALWLAAGASAFTRFEFAPALHLSARIGLLRTLQDLEFTLENVGLVYAVPPWVGRLNLGVELHFD